MATEVERKFLVAGLPPGVRDAMERGGTRFRQAYLASEGDVEVRLRLADDTAVLTVKAGSGLVRTEVELTIDAEAAEALWPHAEHRRLEKTRYRVPVGGHVAELDVFHGGLDGTLVVEVEFTSEAEARTFAPPDWFGAEVTGNAAWSNAALARAGVAPTTPS